MRFTRPLILFLVIAISTIVVWTWRTGEFPKPLRGLFSSPEGTLEIHLKDHREAIDDFAKLEVTVVQVSIRPRLEPGGSEAPWRSIVPSVKRVDLTQYTGSLSAMIFSGPQPVDTFEAINLQLEPVTGVAKETGEVIPIKNQISPIKLGFSIDTGKVTKIVIDLVVLDISDHPPRGYELHIKGYEIYTDGRLIQRIPPA
ncbi:MAG: DUF4382 domain-containing protein [Deltaproteobacteria bacterium]|nr:DUF4382 domain-containing protein [Deltaproteobacteria bacterium]